MCVGNGLHNGHPQTAAGRGRSRRTIESIEHTLAFLRRYTGPRIYESQ